MSKKKFSNSFSLNELFSNSSGKTSASGFIGFITSLSGVLTFIAGVVLTFLSCWNTCEAGAGTNIMTQSIALIGIGSALLGVRKFTSTNEKSSVETENESETENEDR